MSPVAPVEVGMRPRHWVPLALGLAFAWWGGYRAPREGASPVLNPVCRFTGSQMPTYLPQIKTYLILHWSVIVLWGVVLVDEPEPSTHQTVPEHRDTSHSGGKVSGDTCRGTQESECSRAAGGRWAGMESKWAISGVSRE